MENLIHVHIYEPHKGSLFGSTKEDRSELHKYTCENADKCEAFKFGMCINVGNVFGARCPHGRKSVLEGFTQRAGKYHSQIREWKETYAETYQKLKTAPKRVFHVFGGWMLPYAHINMSDGLPFHGKPGFFQSGSPFLNDDDFTPDVFAKIIRQRPQAMMGGEIEAYQKEQVPKLIKDLHDHYPDKFNEVADDLARSMVENYDYVGRKVFLKTVVPNCEVTISKNVWFWDGKTISRKDEKTMIFEPISWESNIVQFTPDDKATIKVTDNAQVDKNTKLAD